MSIALEKAFKRNGIGVKLGVTLDAARPVDDGVEVTLSDGTALTADLLLVAVGRAPVSDGIGLEAAGVELDRGFVKVDEVCRTSSQPFSRSATSSPRRSLRMPASPKAFWSPKRSPGSTCSPSTIPVSPVSPTHILRWRRSD